MIRFKLGFAMYWLFFAALAVLAAKNPGYVHHPELVPFPFVPLVVLWSILALTTATFYFILQPLLFRTSMWRLPCAVALCALLLFLSFQYASFTDLPGLYYVPFYFSCLTMLLLVVVALSTIGRSLYRRAKSAP